MARDRSGKRIGFVDFNLNNFHANVYYDLITKDLAARGYAVVGATAMKEGVSREWAEQRGVPWFETVNALNDVVDAFVVLAPGHPETHLPLCRQVLPCGKTTYVDKTFAPDLATARKIFALADRYKVAVQTSSALRYTNVQAHVADVGGRARVRHMVAWGGGRSFDEYAIHPVELVVSCMGPKIQRLTRRGSGKQTQLLVDFSGGRTAVINVYVQAETPFAAAVTTAAGTTLLEVDGAALFRNMASAILDLFDAGRAQIDRAETYAVRRILDAAGKENSASRWMPLK